MSAFFEVPSWRRTTSLPALEPGAKIRLGNNAREQQYKVYLPVAEAAAETLDYLVVHARNGDQRSRDPPSWEAIAEVKYAVGGSSSALRVIGNGDVRTPDDVRRIQAMTGCDGVMVGRAAMRNPWCLTGLAAAAAGGNLGPLNQPSLATTARREERKCNGVAATRGARPSRERERIVVGAQACRVALQTLSRGELCAAAARMRASFWMDRWATRRGHARARPGACRLDGPLRLVCRMEPGVSPQAPFGPNRR